MRRWLLLLVVAVPVLLRGQTSTPLAFDVASIKRNDGVDARQTSRMLPGGRIEVTNMPLRTLIRIAYGTTGGQVVGGPDWLASDGYDVVAKAPADVSLEGPRGLSPAVMTMLKKLLEERCHLQAHSESRETQTYALVRANDGGRLGPELRMSTADCHTPNACGIRGGNGDLRYVGLTIAQIATSIAGFAAVRTTVVDRTSLMGRYDLHLTFNDDTGPNLFTALREEAGLRLQSEKAQTEFIVIDHVERPTPD